MRVRRFKRAKRVREQISDLRFAVGFFHESTPRNIHPELWPQQIGYLHRGPIRKSNDLVARQSLAPLRPLLRSSPPQLRSPAMPSIRLRAGLANQRFAQGLRRFAPLASHFPAPRFKKEEYNIREEKPAGGFFPAFFQRGCDSCAGEAQTGKACLRRHANLRFARISRSRAPERKENAIQARAGSPKRRANL